MVNLNCLLFSIAYYHWLEISSCNWYFILSQAAFLSSLVGVEVAEAAAHAAVIELSDTGFGGDGESVPAVARDTGEQGIELCFC